MDGLRPLPIPPLAPSTVEGGVRRFGLDIRAGTTEIRAGQPIPTRGYSGSILGPTLRARRGEQVAVDVRNNLSEATTVHWHGMHLPAVYDGGPHQTIPPGGVWSPSWTVRQQAATLWYHPHPHGHTQHQAYRGLAGLFLLDDDESDRLGLPKDYGVDDIPLVVQDKKFTPDGLLDETDDEKMGLLGTVVTTNGIAGTYLTVTAGRVRLRILNGSTMRLYNFGFEDGSGFHIIAGDGGLLAEPVPARRLVLSPGERAEIIVENSPGARKMLRAFPFPDNAGIVPAPGIPGFGLGDAFDVLQLRAADALDSSPALPASLAALAPMDLTGASTRTMTLQPTKINDVVMDMERIDFQVPLGTTEIWELTNDRDWLHNFHIHDSMFRILDIGGHPPPPELAGWKDTVNVPPRGSVRLAIRFTDYADPRWPYMYHCHMMFHEDLGMMGQFLVLAPDQQPADVIGSGHGTH